MNNQHITQMVHKYSVGDKVRVTPRHTWLAGSEGEIAAPIPFTFLAPGYYVTINGSKLALSERSLEKVEIMPLNGDERAESTAE